VNPITVNRMEVVHMLYKGWIPFLIAPLALSMVACSQNGGPPSAAPASPYAGVWANENAITTYRQFKDNPRQFCGYVRANPTAFGVGQNLVMDAVEIESNGDIYRYQPMAGHAALSNPVDAQLLKWGNVDGDGNFKHNQTPVPNDPNFYRSQYANFDDQDPRFGFTRADAKLYNGSSNNRLKVTSFERTGEASIYLRSDDQEMLRMAERVVDCSGGGSGGGTQPAPQGPLPLAPAVQQAVPQAAAPANSNLPPGWVKVPGPGEAPPQAQAPAAVAPVPAPAGSGADTNGMQWEKQRFIPGVVPDGQANPATQRLGYNTRFAMPGQ
jgi:hypothetical protein